MKEPVPGNIFQAQTCGNVPSPLSQGRGLTVTLHKACGVQEDLAEVQQDIVAGVRGLPPQQGQQVPSVDISVRLGEGMDVVEGVEPSPSRVPNMAAVRACPPEQSLHLPHFL